MKFFSRTDDCILLGKGKIGILTERESLLLDHDIDNCWSYNRFIFKGVRYVNTVYHETQCCKHNDSVVLLRSGHIGKILKIYKISHGGEEKVILFIDLFQIERNFLTTPDVTIDHIKKCRTVDNIQMFTPADLLRPCLHVKIKESEYVILILYGCYGD